MSNVITSTVWITVAMTGYNAPVDTNLACPHEVYSRHTGPWVALPIEWVKGGYVDCGDYFYGMSPTGFGIEASVFDTGCMLHYPALGTNRPHVVDLPRLLYPASEYPTTTKGQIAIWSVRRGGWIQLDKIPLTAWATQYCNGPLSWSWPEDGPQPY